MLLQNKVHRLFHIRMSLEPFIDTSGRAPGPMQGPINQVTIPQSSNIQIAGDGKSYDHQSGFPLSTGLPDDNMMIHPDYGSTMQNMITADPNRYEEFYDVYSDFYDDQSSYGSHYDDLGQTFTGEADDSWRTTGYPLSEELKRKNFDQTIENLGTQVFASYQGQPGRPAGLFGEGERQFPGQLNYNLSEDAYSVFGGIKPPEGNGMLSQEPDTTFFSGGWNEPFKPGFGTILHESILHGSGARHNIEDSSMEERTGQGVYKNYQNELSKLFTGDEYKSLMSLATQ